MPEDNSGDHKRTHIDKGEAKGICLSIEEMLALQQPARHLADSLSQLSRSMLQGNRPAKMQGRGGAFDQLRQYLVGDDVRNIDWKVTARTGQPYVRVFTEERERPLLVLVDQTADMFFATRKQMKSVVAAQIATFLLWMSFNNKRPCGGILVGDQHVAQWRPRSNKSHLHGLLTDLAQFNLRLANTSQPTPTCDQFSHALAQLNQIAPREALVVLISDFQQLDQQGWDAIERLNRKVDLIATPIYDGIASKLPQSGHFLASYTGLEAELDFSSVQSRIAISSGIEQRLSQLQQRFAENRIPTLMFSTFDEVESQLLSALMIDGGERDRR